MQMMLTTRCITSVSAEMICSRSSGLVPLRRHHGASIQAVTDRLKVDPTHAPTLVAAIVHHRAEVPDLPLLDVETTLLARMTAAAMTETAITMIAEDREAQQIATAR